MLFILLQEILWYKKDRTPQGSVIRRQYLKPVRVEEAQIDPAGDEVILWTRSYTQDGNEMQEEKGLYKNPLVRGRLAIRRNGLERTADNIEILKEGDAYRIRWFESGEGRVRRHGGNEDFDRNWQRLIREDPGLLCETAFVLKKGESGIMRWNNRFASYSGQWYRQYQAYFIHTDSMDRRMFIRDYDYTYEQLADLF